MSSAVMIGVKRSTISEHLVKNFSCSKLYEGFKFKILR